MSDPIELEMIKIRGEINTFSEKTNGRFEVIERRLISAENWVGKSEAFHVEMRTFRDDLIGAQKEAEKNQRLRHATNTTLIALLILIAAYIAIVVSLFPEHKAIMAAPKIMGSEFRDPVLSLNRPQDASITPSE